MSWALALAIMNTGWMIWKSLFGLRHDFMSITCMIAIALLIRIKRDISIYQTLE